MAKVKALRQPNIRRRRSLVFYILMLAFPIAQVLIFYFAVNFNSILLAFKEYNYGLDGQIAGYTWVGFENFKRCFYDFFHETALVYSLKNSLIAFAVNVCVSMTLTLLFSYYIYKKRFLHGFFKVLLFLPSVISPLVITVIYKVLLEDGLPQYFLKLFDTTISPVYSANTFASLIFYYVITGFGSGILIYTSAMSSIDSSVIEAAKLDGATGIKEFIHVIFPMIFPTFITFFTVGIATLFTNQLNLFSFEAGGAEKKLYTFGYYLYIKTVGGTLADYPYLSAMGLIMTFVVVPLTFLSRNVLGKLGPRND